jgi:activator of the mannose operon (transcriptional antiterminator)
MRERTKELLTLLARAGGYVTAEELANSLAVSSKTIYRLVEKINAVHTEPLIVTSRGKGVKLLSENAAAPVKPVMPSGHSEFSPLQRQNKVLLTLLFKAPYYVQRIQLFAAYYVSDSVIQSDLTAISNLLAADELKLVRDHTQVAVSGKEENIRRAINHTLERLNLFSVTSISEFSAGATGLDKFDQAFIVGEINRIERTIDGDIPYPYNINLFSHMYTLIMRARNGRWAEADYQMTPVDVQTARDNAVLYELAKVIIGDFDRYLVAQLPLTEELNIFQYLLSIQLGGEASQLLPMAPEVSAFTRFLTDQVARRSHLVLDAASLTDLERHIQPMLNRLRNEITVKNVWMTEIKKQYGDLFKVIAQALTAAAKHFRLAPISADEAGFVTLYFARCMEEQDRPKRVVIMCTSGQGTSELLRVKVNKYFPDLVVPAVISTAQYTEDNMSTWHPDVVLSTVHVQPIDHVPVLLVSALFGDLDRTNLRHILNDQAEAADAH